MFDLNKSLFKFLGGGAVLVLLGVLALYAPGYWQKYQVDKAIAELERPYREDIYGGKTPEETFDLFLDALKKGDTDLAGKYFTVRKQSEYKEKFEKMRGDGTLDEQIQEWERVRKEWAKVVDEYNNWKTHATVRYTTIVEKGFVKRLPGGENNEGIEVSFSPGKYGNDIIFDLNELTNVWKIAQL